MVSTPGIRKSQSAFTLTNHLLNRCDPVHPCLGKSSLNSTRHPFTGSRRAGMTGRMRFIHMETGFVTIPWPGLKLPGSLPGQFVMPLMPCLKRSGTFLPMPVVRSPGKVTEEREGLTRSGRVSSTDLFLTRKVVVQ
ncbi:MAG: hypothetical protein BWY45_03411 [Euryarchaeota archaeon ADurb.Bin294]|nr:MAG: hypothetical protein BWY45_03411 [Euryarchaeota archaeon ADurb.Bin294]